MKYAISCIVAVAALSSLSWAQQQCGAIPFRKPSAENTGPHASVALVPTGTLTITTDGAVVSGISVSGIIIVRAHNVTIRDFKVVSNTWYGVLLEPGWQNMRLYDGEISGAISSGILADSFTASHLNIHDTGSDAIKTAGPCLVEYSWFHHLGTDPVSHADGVQIRWGHDITIRRNNFDMPWPTPPGYLSNACILADANLGPTVRVNIIQNWLNGGNYSVYIDDNGGAGPPVDCQIIGNNFGRDYQFGVLVNQGSGTVIRRNAWEDTGECMSINN